MCDPLKPPWSIEGRVVFSPHPFPDKSADVYQLWCHLIQPFESFPDFLICDPLQPPKMPPGVLWGELYLSFYLYLYTMFDQRRLDIIDQVEHGRSPQQVTHLPPVWDILLPLAYTPDRRDQRRLVSLPKDTGKVG